MATCYTVQERFPFSTSASLLLGRGVSCEVFALEERLYPSHPPLCIKLFTQSEEDAGRALRLAHSEATYLAALAQVPGVPRVVGVGCEPPCLVMTRHAASFHEFLDTSPSDVKILQAFKELCHVMTGVHSAGITHNDIKMGNVSVDGSGRAIQVTLLDAGNMTHIGESVYKSYTGQDAEMREKQRREKYPWYAPELFLGGPASPQTDVFSLGYLMQEVVKSFGLRVHKQLLDQLALCVGQPATRPTIKQLITGINRSIGKAKRGR